MRRFFLSLLRLPLFARCFFSLLRLPSFARRFSASSIFASGDVPIAILRRTVDGAKQMSFSFFLEERFDVVPPFHRGNARIPTDVDCR